jgi:PadR family transcriptional regulator PadR
LLVAGCWLLVAGCWWLVAGGWLLVAGCWWLVSGCWLLVFSLRLLPAACCLPPASWQLTGGRFHSLTMYSLAMGDKSEIPPGTLYMLVLKTLARLGEMHGYGIAQYILQISDEVLQVEEGSLYPALQRMLIKGWVVAEWKQSESNRRARFYRLTADGRKQLARELKEFERVMAAIVRVIRPA